MLINAAAAGTTALLLLGGSTADAPRERAAPALSVQMVSVAGSGCPAGSGPLSVTTSPSGLTLRFPGLSARGGGSASITERRRFCQIGLDIDRPGWTYQLTKAAYSGRADLAAGAVGSMRADYYFSGERPTVQHGRTLTGPRRTAWQGSDTIQVKRLGWASCTTPRTLNIKTEVKVTPGTDKKKTSLFRIGSGEESAATYRLAWKKC